MAHSSAPASELVIHRRFDATRERLFAAWTDPARRLHWAPPGFTTIFCSIDLRPGGAYHFGILSAEGRAIWCKGAFKIVIPGEYAEYTSYFSDAQGNLVRPELFGLPPDWPIESVVTISFDQREDHTQVTVRQAPIAGSVSLNLLAHGWDEWFDGLAEYLGSTD